MTMKSNDKCCYSAVTEGSLFTTLTFFDDFWVMMIVNEFVLALLKFKESNSSLFFYMAYFAIKKPYDSDVIYQFSQSQ